MKVRFITATPWNIVEGSGTYAGVATLARALRGLGVEVEVLAPQFRLPVYTAQWLLFNEQLRWRGAGDCDLVVGFDMDGYRVAGRGPRPHIASLKGVIADEMRFEKGATRFTMSIQAACEGRHVRRANLVMTTSRYAARRIEELYGVPVRSIVPESIDLGAWRQLFERNPTRPDPSKFTVLCVCRFYPRKRVHLLLGAAARLRERIPNLAVRIVGGGPEYPRLRELHRAKNLSSAVQFLGSVSQPELAREYNRSDLFCLPSVQEGFGIVFLEAMAAGRPIVAARAAAVPEVVEHGVLAEPDSEDALAEAIYGLYRHPDRRAALASAGARVVEHYDAERVAGAFLEEARKLLTAGSPPDPGRRRT